MGVVIGYGLGPSPVARQSIFILTGMGLAMAAFTMFALLALDAWSVAFARRDRSPSLLSVSHRSPARAGGGSRPMAENLCFS